MYEFYMDGVRLPITPSALTIKIKIGRAHV